jgi:hypothetical protein
MRRVPPTVGGEQVPDPGLDLDAPVRDRSVTEEPPVTEPPTVRSAVELGFVAAVVQLSTTRRSSSSAISRSRARRPGRRRTKGETFATAGSLHEPA